MERNFYKFFNLRPDFTEDDLLHAYKKVLIHASNLERTSEEEKSFLMLLNEAYETLSDPDKRIIYDSLHPDFLEEAQHSEDAIVPSLFESESGSENPGDAAQTATQNSDSASASDDFSKNSAASEESPSSDNLVDGVRVRSWKDEPEGKQHPGTSVWMEWKKIKKANQQEHPSAAGARPRPPPPPPDFRRKSKSKPQNIWQKIEDESKRIDQEDAASGEREGIERKNIISQEKYLRLKKKFRGINIDEINLHAKQFNKFMKISGWVIQIVNLILAGIIIYFAVLKKSDLPVDYYNPNAGTIEKARIVAFIFSIIPLITLAVPFFQTTDDARESAKLGCYICNFALVGFLFYIITWAVTL